MALLTAPLRQTIAGRIWRETVGKGYVGLVGGILVEVRHGSRRQCLAGRHFREGVGQEVVVTVDEYEPVAGGNSHGGVTGGANRRRIQRDHVNVKVGLPLGLAAVDGQRGGNQPFKVAGRLGF